VVCAAKIIFDSPLLTDMEIPTTTNSNLTWEHSFDLGTLVWPGNARLTWARLTWEHSFDLGTLVWPGNTRLTWEHSYIATYIHQKWQTVAPAYGVYISQLIRDSRDCVSYHTFIDRGLRLPWKLLSQWYILVKLKSSLRRLYGLHHDFVNRYEIHVSQMTTFM
jgi:hypothetical protein